MADFTKDDLIEWFNIDGEEEKIAKITDDFIDELNGDLDDARERVFQEYYYRLEG